MQLPTSHPAAAATSLQASPSHTPTTPSFVGHLSLCMCTHTWTHPSLSKWPCAVQLFRLNATTGCQSLSVVPVTHTASSVHCAAWASAIRVFVLHWRRVCLIRPSQAKRVAEASPLCPSPTDSHLPPPVPYTVTAPTSQGAVTLFFILFFVIWLSAVPHNLCCTLEPGLPRTE